MTFIYRRIRPKQTFDVSHSNVSHSTGDACYTLSDQTRRQDNPTYQPSKAELKTLLTSLLDLTPLPTAIVCLESNFIFLKNALVTSLFDKTNLNDFEYLTPDFYANPSDYIQLVTQLKNQETIAGRELQLQRRTGEIFDAVVAAKPVTYNGVQAALLTWTDSSHQKKHHQIEADWQRFAALVENSSDFIAMSSLEGQILYVNEAGRKLVGLENLEEARSKNIGEYLPNEDLVHFCEVTLPTLQTTGRHEGEGQLRHFKTGECFDMHRSCFTVKHPETGDVLCLATIQRNVTAQKQAERALRESEERSKARANQQAAISKLGQRALEGVELSRLMHEAVNLVTQVLGVPLCGILELLSGGSALQLQAALLHD